MGVPSLSSATVGSTGLTVSLVWSEAVNHNSAGGTVANVYRGFSSAAAYASGDGTTTLNYTIADTVYAGESVTLTGFTVTSVSNSQAGAALDSQASTNSSSVTCPCTGKAARLLVNTCTIRRPIKSQSNTSAGKKTAWGDAYVNVCCSVQAVSGSEAEFWGTMATDSVYKVYLSSSVDITGEDRLTNFAGPSSLESTDVLEVASDPLDHAGRAAYTMVMARAVQSNA